MGERRRCRGSWGSWGVGAFTAVVMAVALPTSPATAAAMSPTGPVRGAPVALAPAAHLARQAPTVSSNGVSAGAPVLDAASAPSDAASSSAASGSGLVARLGEARRANGGLGQWVVVALLGIVIALWVALVAVVVRVRLHVARRPGSNPAGRLSDT